MLGRIRVPPSPLESLELEERSPLKIVKQDSLSIYETTLLKLKEGSQRSLSSPDEGLDSTSSEQNPRLGMMMLDEAFASGCCSATISASQNKGDLHLPSGLSSAQHKGRNLSISHLFSKYERSCETSQ
ncbi:hypothetical protein Dimus_004638 [Dionaea muscipula]